MDEEIVLELKEKKKHIKPKTTGIPKKKKIDITEILKTNRFAMARP